MYVAKANEVLTDPERKMSYDYYHTASPEEYAAAFVREYSVIPPLESPVWGVIIGVLSAMSLLSWVIQRQKFERVKRHVYMAAIMDLPAHEGGPKESKVRGCESRNDISLCKVTQPTFVVISNAVNTTSFATRSARRRKLGSSL